MSSPGLKTAMGRLLLISNDSAVIEQVAEGMRAFGITTEVCGEVGMALPLLSRQKFEAVMVDVEVGQAEQILEQLRLSPSNRTAVTFAITDPQKPAPLVTQPNFVMEKPLSAEFSRTHFESRVRSDRARTPPLFPLPYDGARGCPERWPGVQLPRGQYQRGRHGHCPIARTEARWASTSSVHPPRTAGSFHS